MSPSFAARNPGVDLTKAGMCMTKVPPTAAPKLNVKISKSSEEEGLNTFEKQYLAYLRMMKYPWIGVQALKFRLAYNTHYTPDFVFVNFNGELEAHETKGFMRDDAAVKIKVAARSFPIVKFVLVTRKNKEWIWQAINP